MLLISEITGKVQKVLRLRNMVLSIVGILKMPAAGAVVRERVGAGSEPQKNGPAPQYYKT
jgi:hypothetical protein